MTTISMTDPVLDGSPNATGFSPASPAAPGLGWAGMGGPIGPPGGVDHDFGDMKMAVRTDDHLDGAMTWFLCDGRAISRAVYAQLFAVIGVAYGVGDGLTTFNIPNFCVDPAPGAPIGRFPVGYSPTGYALGAAFGEERHVHDMTAWITGMLHVYNPVQTVQGVPTQPATLGAGVWCQDGNPHSHLMPGVFHTAGPYTTDVMAADSINPYTAVGFFIRVL